MTTKKKNPTQTVKKTDAVAKAMTFNGLETARTVFAKSGLRGLRNFERGVQTYLRTAARSA